VEPTEEPLRASRTCTIGSRPACGASCCGRHCWAGAGGAPAAYHRSSSHGPPPASAGPPWGAKHGCIAACASGCGSAGSAWLCPPGGSPPRWVLPAGCAARGRAALPRPLSI